MSEYGQVPGNGRAYGDILYVQTPALDRMSQQLYQEHRQRELYKQKQDENLDNEFKALLPGIRTGDTAKFAELYNDYKTSWQQLQNKPPQKQADYLAAQQDLLRKKAAMYNHVTNSKAFAEKEKRKAGLLYNDKTGQYEDTTYDIMQQGLKQPYDQLLEITDPKTGQKTKIDWTDPETGKRHIDTKGVMDAIKYSTGDKQVYSGDKYKEKPTDTQWVQPEITVRNKPTQFFDNMKLAATKDPISFLNTLPHPSGEEYFNAEKHYNEALTPEVRKMWKMQDGEDLPPDDNLTPVEKAIKYQAITYALTNLPLVKNKPVTDKDAAMIAQDKLIRGRQILAAGLAQGNWTSREKYKSDAVAAGIALKDVDADKLFETAIRPDRSLALDPTLLGDDPEVKNAVNLKLSPDGKMVEYDINYYKDGKITDTKHDSRPVATVKKKMIHDLGLKDSKVPPPAPKKTSYSYNGKTYTPQQIEKAAKQSNLSTDDYIKKYGIK